MNSPAPPPGGNQPAPPARSQAPQNPPAPPVIGPIPGTIFVPVMGSGPSPFPMQLPLPMLAQQQVVQQVQVWQGPYPPPEALREYEAVQPGAFNRMLTMAEQAQAAQIQSIQRAQENQRRDTKRGQLLGTGVSVIAMGLAVYCAVSGQAVVGSLLLAVPVMAVAKALIEGVRRPAATQPETREARLPTGSESEKSEPR